MTKTSPTLALTALTLLLGLACQAPEPRGLTVSGRVLAADGTPPRLGHVHLSRVAGGENVLTVAVGPGGEFTVEVPDDDVYRLDASAVDHEQTGVPVVGGSAEVEIVLAPNVLADPLTEARILGEWNDFSLRGAEAMERRDDGTFVHVVEDAGETVAYQLAGVTQNGHTVNGTQADAFEYDGGGDYHSIVNTEDSRAEIVFDPSRMPEPRDGLPRLETQDTALARAFTAEQEASRAGAAGKGGEDGDAEVWSVAKREISAVLDDESAPAPLRAHAAALLLKAPSEVWSDEERQRAIATLPASSPFWSVAGWAVSNLDADRQAELVEALSTGHPDPTVRAMALAAFVKKARRDGDEEAWQRYHAQLVEYEKSSPLVRFMAGDLAPDRRIQVGQPVPEFDVALLDPATATVRADRVSSQSLEGNTYLLDFWATWCVPCVAELPRLHAAYDLYRDRGFTIVSLSFDQSVDAIPPFLEGRDEKMPWLHAFVEDGFTSDLAQSFEVRGIPEPILIGADGKIIATHETLRGEDLDATLAQVFGE